MPFVTVNVELDLDQISDEDIMEEVTRRDLQLENQELIFDQEQKQLLEKIYHYRRNHQNFDVELDQLIKNVLGRIL